MILLEWLINKPCFVIPLCSFLVGLCMVILAPLSYMARTKEIIIAPKTIIDNYSDREQKWLLYGFGLLVLGIIGVSVVNSFYDK